MLYNQGNLKRHKLKEKKLHSNKNFLESENTMHITKRKRKRKTAVHSQQSKKNKLAQM